MPNMFPCCYLERKEINVLLKKSQIIQLGWTKKIIKITRQMEDHVS